MLKFDVSTEIKNSITETDQIPVFIEFLDSVVAHIRDIDIALTVNRNPSYSLEHIIVIDFFNFAFPLRNLILTQIVFRRVMLA